MKLLYAITITAVLLTALWLGGCSDNNAAAGGAQVGDGAGKAQVTIQWPTRSRLIPAGANCVMVNIAGANGYSVTQEADRPVTSGTTTLDFTELPTHTLSVTATAYPRVGGAGVAQASGTTSLTPLSGQMVPLTLTLNSTIDHLTVTPGSFSITQGQNSSLTATAYDQSGDVVLVGTGKIGWIASKQNVATVNPSGAVIGVGVGSATITATDTESGKQGSASVTVTAAAATTVQISPSQVTVSTGDTQQFTASVANNPNMVVTWKVVEGGGGSISAGGLYTAPVVNGTYHVTATSVADTTQTATATVTVIDGTMAQISPSQLTMSVGDTQLFTATVTNNPNTAVTWSVQETGGGSISANGLYTAPATSGTYAVTATSVADTTKSATATVTVQAGSSTVVVN